jgi:lipopolysaccharide transport system ATP-binding protein
MTGKTNSESEVLVQVEGLSKKFCRDLRKSLWYGVQDVFSELLPFSNSGVQDEGHGLRSGEFWAVRDVQFSLKRGECLGLIGHNGAGKTTLLRILNGLIKPDRGSAVMRGRVGALIALGAGFNPILSGRENIYVNASILGLSKKEIDAKLNDIIDFSEVGDFIDSPVQSYSSGMQVRLGFAIATALKPDILLLDEVLAVGDASFRHKCYGRINKIIKDCAVIMVSHDMGSIGAICSSVGFMEKGHFSFFQDVTEGIGAYNRAMDAKFFESGRETTSFMKTNSPIEAAEVAVLTPEVNYGEAFEVSVKLNLSEDLRDVAFSFTAVDSSEQSVMNWNLNRHSIPVDLEKGICEFRFSIPELFLHDGIYRWNLWIGRNGSIEANLYAIRAGAFKVVSKFKPLSGIPYLPPPTCFNIHKVETT